MKILVIFSILYLISCDIGQIGYFENACPQGWQQFVNGRGRHIIGEGQYLGAHTDGSNDSKSFRVGDTGGQTSHRLTIEEMPNHNHNNGNFKYLFQQNCFNTQINSDYSCGYPNIKTMGQLLSSGGDQFHNNLSPYIVLKGCKQIADKDKQQITKIQAALENITSIVLTLVNQINTAKQKIELLQQNSTEQAQKLQNQYLIIQQNNNSSSQLVQDLQQKMQTLNSSSSQLVQDLEQKIQTLNSSSSQLGNDLQQKMQTLNSSSSQSVQDLELKIQTLNSSSSQLGKDLQQKMQTLNSSYSQQIGELKIKDGLLDIKIGAITDLSPQQLTNIKLKNIYLETDIKTLKNELKIEDIKGSISLVLASLSTLAVIIEINYRICKYKKNNFKKKYSLQSIH